MAPLEALADFDQHPPGSEGATYEYLRDYTEDINRLVDSLVPEAQSVTARVSSGSGNVRIALTDISTRKRSQMEIAEELSAAVRTKTKARAFVQQQSTFGDRDSMPVRTSAGLSASNGCRRCCPNSCARSTKAPCSRWPTST